MFLAFAVGALLAAPLDDESVRASAGYQRTWSDERGTVGFTSAKASARSGHWAIDGGLFMARASPFPSRYDRIWSLRGGWSARGGEFLFGVLAVPLQTSWGACGHDGDCSGGRVQTIPLPSVSVRIGPLDGIHGRAGFLEIEDGGVALLRAGIATGDATRGTLLLGWTLDMVAGRGPFAELEFHAGLPGFVRITVTLGKTGAVVGGGPSLALALGARW